MSKIDGTVLVTGFPAFTARRLIRLLLGRGEKATFLVQPKFADLAREFVKSCAEEGLQGSAEVLVGDVLHLDLGLSGKELKRLSKEVRRIHHMAAIYYHNVPYGLAEGVNVEGTRNVLDLAADLDALKRVVFYSTAFVSGDRSGVIMEEELEEGQQFRNAYEKTKYLAEQLAGSRTKDLPLSVVRPSIIVGDSRTGEIDRMDGPYYLVRTIVNFPVDVHIPLPGGGTYPLNMVPVDFVAAAADVISRDPNAAGKTFHLTDPNPMSARRVFEVVADVAGRKRPKGMIPSLAYRYLFRLPYVESLLRPQRHFVEMFNQLTIYNCMNTLQCLAGTGVQCPAFPSYATALVGYVQRRDHERHESAGAARAGEEAEEDAFY